MKVYAKPPRWFVVSVVVLLASLLATGCPAAIQQNRPATDPMSQPVSSDDDAAGGAAPGGGGVVSGRVTDPSGQPLAEATVSVSKGTAPAPEITAITSADGFYQWDLPAGTFTLEARKDGFQLAAVEVTVSAGEASIQDIVLQPE